MEKPDMTLSEFIGVCTAIKNESNNDWSVNIRMSNGTPDGILCCLIVYDAMTEFEAKERVFLYLKEKIQLAKIKKCN